MNIPVYLEFPNLEYIHNLTMQAIATHCSFLLFVLRNSAVSRAQSDEDEVAKEVQNLLDHPTMAQHQRRQPQPRPTIIWHQPKLPNSRSQVAQQPAILDAVLETTAKLSQVATVM